MPTIQEVQQRCLALAGNPASVVAPKLENNPKYWYYESFTQQDVAVFKALLSERRGHLTTESGVFDRMGEEQPSAWTGFGGELAFRKMLEGPYGLVDGIGFIENVDNTRRDKVDFTIATSSNPLLVDVKTKVMKTPPPKMDYVVDLESSQYKKLMQPNCPINTLAFCFYLLPEDRCVVVGWLTVKEFDKLKVLHRGGSDNGKGGIVKRDVYNVFVHQLRPFRKVVG